MDRFSWDNENFGNNERLVTKQGGIRLYDGEQKTAFDNGVFVLTTHRLIWKDQRRQDYTIGLPLKLAIYADEQAATFTKSAKITLHLSSIEGEHPPGPVHKSSYNFVRCSFKDGGHSQFLKHLNETLQTKAWEQKSELPVAKPGGRTRAGIMGIERTMQARHQATDKSISEAFSDLKELMDKAKDMVTLSKNIAAKIKEKQGEITEDETIQFKSYLLSLGIPDPVTRSTHGSGDKYFQELAREVSSTMEKVLKENGGVMTLPDVFCRINRARGMELLSPDDLLAACQMMESLQLPVRMRKFESGVIVLQLQSHSEQAVIKSTKEKVSSEGSLTAEELARIVNVSVILAKERLLLTEKAGGVCRDETVEGLRFYPNKFLEMAA